MKQIEYCCEADKIRAKLIEAFLSLSDDRREKAEKKMDQITDGAL